MKSLVAKRSVIIAGRKTSVSLEDAFWSCLREIAEEREETVSGLIATINADRQHGNLSSALRPFVLGFYRRRQPEKTGDRSMLSGSLGGRLKPTGEFVAGNGSNYA
jgi:predicted DNA-binding ribbon-helix-helix protein